MSGTNKANQREPARHKARYDAYRNSMTREVNKARKIGKHLDVYPDDQQALDEFMRLPIIARIKSEH